MVSKIFLFLLLLAHLQPQAFVKGDATLIKKTCKNTKYYDLCFSSLKSDPSSTNADPKGLALIMVGIGMANATSTSLYLSSQLLGTANDSSKRVLKECADKYSYASNALQACAQNLANEAYDYASMHITAASDYSNVCHNMFKRYQGLVYPPELPRREDGLKRICDVALGIVENLDWQLVN